MRRPDLRAPRLNQILIYMVMVIVSAALLVTTALYVGQYRRAALQTACTTGIQAVRQVAGTVSTFVAENSNAMGLLAAAIGLPETQREEYLDAFLEMQPEIVAATTYDETGALLDCWALDRQPRDLVLRNLSFDRERAVGMGDSLITEPHVNTLFEGWYPWVVTLVRRVEAPGGVRFAALDISFVNISATINNVGIGEHGYCFLVDENGAIVYHPQQQLIFAGLKAEDTGVLAKLENGSTQKGSVIYSVAPVENSPWRVVGVSYMDEVVNRNVSELLSISLLIAVVMLAATWGTTLLLSQAVGQPLQSLADAMHDFEQNADQFAFREIRGTQEVQALSAAFGHMVGRIQQLMATVRREETVLRKTELKALQAQINPHFLYNTLDSIAWMCEQGKTADAVKMVNALARLFRISISRGHDLIPIEREIEHARSYLEIQKYRYKDQFSYCFEVDEACCGYLCNKITLQPLIENALTHGLDLMVDEGHIKVQVLQDGGDILFRVTDDGVGMEPELAASLLHREPTDRTGIGIKNVHERLRIYFGEPYGLGIESEPDVGTTVTVRMPKVKEGEYEPK